MDPDPKHRSFEIEKYATTPVSDDYINKSML